MGKSGYSKIEITLHKIMQFQTMNSSHFEGKLIFGICESNPRLILAGPAGGGISLFAKEMEDGKLVYAMYGVACGINEQTGEPRGVSRFHKETLQRMQYDLAQYHTKIGSPVPKLGYFVGMMGHFETDHLESYTVTMPSDHW